MANGIIDLRSKKAITNNSNSLDSKKNITDHTQLINRNLPDQHSISAISGLQDRLEAVGQIVNDAKQELQNTTQIIQNDINISFANMQAALQDDVEQVKEDTVTRLADFRETVINPSLKNLAARLEAANSQTNSNLTELDTCLTSRINNNLLAIENHKQTVTQDLTELSDILTATFNTKVLELTTQDSNNKADLENKIDQTAVELTDKLDDLDEQLTQLVAEEVADLTTQTDQLSQKTEQGISELSTNLTNLADQVDKNISALNTQVTADLTTLDQKIDTSISNLNTQVDTNISNLNTQVTADLATLGQKIDTGLQDLSDDIGTVDSALNDLNSEVDTIKDTLGLSSAGSDNSSETSLLDRVTQLETVIGGNDEGEGSAESSLVDRIAKLESFIGGEGEEDGLDIRLSNLTAYINTLHPITLKVVSGGSAIKHFTDTTPIDIIWQTNRGIGEGSKIYLNNVEVTNMNPTDRVTATSVTYQDTWSPEFTDLPTIPISYTPTIEVKDSEEKLITSTTLNYTYTHYVYCGIVAESLGEFTAQTVTEKFQTDASRFLQTTGNLSNKTYIAPNEGGYLYYLVPLTFIQGKPITVDFDIGRLTLEEPSKTITLSVANTNVEYAVYQVTDTLQTGDIAAAISVQN